MEISIPTSVPFPSCSNKTDVLLFKKIERGIEYPQQFKKKVIIFVLIVNVVEHLIFWGATPLTANYGLSRMGINLNIYIVLDFRKTQRRKPIHNRQK